MAGPDTAAPWALGLLSLSGLRKWLAQYGFQLYGPLTPSHPCPQNPTALAMVTSGALFPSIHLPPGCHLLTTRYLSNATWKRPSVWQALGTHILACPGPCLPHTPELWKVLIPGEVLASS